jgi:hypothetical protein
MLSGMSGDNLYVNLDGSDLLWALNLFRNSLAWGKLRRFWRALSGRCSALYTLSAWPHEPGRGRGRQTVAIAEIVGSEGRAGDFDNTFAPVSERTRDRWISVARARRRGLSLPPVQLVRTECGYYVLDGHHRISVARALGEEFVEAEVIG